MSSGIVLRDKNVEKFRLWMTSMSDIDFKQLVHRGILKRKEIAKECGFSISVLRQNPIVKHELITLENDLRKPDRGILPPLVDKDAAANDQKTVEKKITLREQRLKRLEQDNVALRAKIRGLEEALKKFGFMEKIMTETGRLPR